MRRRWIVVLLGPCLVQALLVGKAFSWDWCHKSAEIPMGTNTEADHNLDRAGHPEEVACSAHAPDDCSYIGYPVGGGAPFHKGDYPCPTDGTWGWDYQGHCFARHEFLYWWHGRRYQGGTGSYTIDGPEVFPHE